MKLEDFRAQIDAIDNELLTLLASRMEIVEKVGRLKRSEGAKGSFIRPKREDAMMRVILDKGAGKFPKEALFSIWRTIISASLQVENPFRVLTTKQAGKEIYEYFGAFSEYVLFDDAVDVIKNMSTSDVGVLPNSADFSQLPESCKVFAKIGNFRAFANIKEDQC